MAVMVTGLIAVWILQLLGAAFDNVGRRCCASALETTVGAVVSKIRLASSLLLLRNTLSEYRHAGYKVVYSAVIFADNTGSGNSLIGLELSVLYCRTLAATRPAVRTIRLFILSVYNV